MILPPTAMTTNQPPDQNEVPSHRACAHCRGQKVRCLPDEDDPDGACQRCKRLGRQCVFTPLQKRKQRKRTDARVAELEKEMRMMRAALQNKRTAAAVQTADNNAFNRPRNDVASTSMVLGQESGDPIEQESSRGPTRWPRQFAAKSPDASNDVIARGLLSLATARTLLEAYRRDLFPVYPIVIIPDDVTADELRMTRPILFLAVMAAAAGKDNADLSIQLDKEVLQLYATRQMVNSEKSLELVQSLLISSIWYAPPTKWGQLKYFDYVNMATSMAMDIGIGTRAVRYRNLGHMPVHESRPANVHPLEDVANPDLSMAPRSREQDPDTGSLESRRTFLACYMICVSMSMSLRRPNMFRVTSYVRESLDYLERSSTEPSARTMAAWVKLHFIMEEICSSFRYYDPGDIASITDRNTQLMLKDFTAKLSAWHADTPESDMTYPLMIVYSSFRLYLNEVVLHVEHSPEDFKAPFQMGPIHPGEGSDEISTQVIADAVADCISSSHSVMDAFTRMEPEKCRGLPIFIYVRVSYAAFVLSKLCLSAAHPSSRIGRVLDRRSLDVESIMDRAVLHVRAIIGSVLCRIPAVFLALMFKLRQWCLDPRLIARSSGAGQDMMEGGVNTYRHLATMRHEGSSSAGGSVANAKASSGDDTSPEDQIDSYQDNPVPYGASIPVDLDATVADRYPDTAYHEGGARAQFRRPPEAMSVSDAPGLSSYIDSMQLDPDLLQLFGDMNAVQQDGIPGLEQWSMISTDLMDLPENFDWQMRGGNM